MQIAAEPLEPPLAMFFCKFSNSLISASVNSISSNLIYS